MFTHIHQYKKLYTGLAISLGALLLFLYDVHFAQPSEWIVLQNRCTSTMTEFYNDSTWEPYRALVKSRLEQYNRFKRIVPNFAFTPGAPKSFDQRNVAERVSVKFKVTYCQLEGHVYIDLSENIVSARASVADMMMYQKSKGGSTIFARVETACNVVLCTYVDYFNGVYSVICPLFSPTVSIKISVLQTNFQQFTGVMRSTNLVVLDTEFRLDQEYENSTVDLPAPGFEHWTTKWRCRKVMTSELCQGVARMQRLYLIGASHMRYQYHYILQSCKGTIPDIKQRLFYIDASFGQDVADALTHISSPAAPSDCTREFQSNLIDDDTVSARFKEHIPKNSSLQIFTFRRTFSKINPNLEKGHKINDSLQMGFCRSEPDMQIGIIIQSGSWDLSFLGLEKSLRDVIPALDTAMGTASRSFKDMNNIKLLVMSPPAFNPTFYSIGRSNGEIQLYSDALEEAASKHGLRFFNTFKALYPAFRDSVDSHYLRCDYEKKPICYGEHGMIVFQDAIRALTDQFEHR